MSKAIDEIQQTRSAIMQLPEMATHIERWGFSFIRAKVLVCNHQKQFLVVEEKRAKVDGKWQDVHDIWNFPGGSLQSPTEDLFAAAHREVLEETGYDVVLDGFLGVHQHLSKDDPCVVFMFTAHCTGEPTGQIDPKEIWSVAWMNWKEIHQLHRAKKMRSATTNMAMLDHRRDVHGLWMAQM